MLLLAWFWPNLVWFGPVQSSPILSGLNCFSPVQSDTPGPFQTSLTWCGLVLSGRSVPLQSILSSVTIWQHLMPFFTLVQGDCQDAVHIELFTSTGRMCT